MRHQRLYARPPSRPRPLLLSSLLLLLPSLLLLLQAQAPSAAGQSASFKVACVNSLTRPGICNRFAQFVEGTPYVIVPVTETELLDSFDEYFSALVDPKTSACLTAERGLSPVLAFGIKDSQGTVVYDVGGVIFTKAGSGIEQLSDLRDKVVAATTTTDFASVHAVFTEYYGSVGTQLVDDAAVVRLRQPAFSCTHTFSPPPSTSPSPHLPLSLLPARSLTRSLSSRLCHVLCCRLSTSEPQTACCTPCSPVTQTSAWSTVDSWRRPLSSSRSPGKTSPSCPRTSCETTASATRTTPPPQSTQTMLSSFQTLHLQR